jgi:hypothetical protein
LTPTQYAKEFYALDGYFQDLKVKEESVSYSLSPSDRGHLVKLDKKLQMVRDRVAGVASGRHTGFWLGGRGGIGKSYTI